MPENIDKNENNFVYTDLTYKINGFCYEIFNQIGQGQTEKVYSKALAELLTANNIKFSRELYFPIKINDKLIAKRYFDFLVDDKVVIELKTGFRNYKTAYTQLLGYLKYSKLKLGLIVRFSPDGVKIKRIANLH
ncbi:MAG: GxxExxY protein [Candidatus Berkelbacteria bacterium]